MSFASAFHTLMWRNYVYRKRRWVSTILEFSLPIIFMLFLLWIKKALEATDSLQPTHVPAYYPSNSDAMLSLSFNDYLTSLQAKKICEVLDGGVTKGITGMNYSNIWPVPFVICDPSKCETNGQDATLFCEYRVLGIAPSENNKESSRAVEEFASWITDNYPSLSNKTALPTELDFVRIFSSDADVDEYVQSGAYGTMGYPKLGGAIVLFPPYSAGQWKYKIRVNSTGVNGPVFHGGFVAHTTPDTKMSFDPYAKSVLDACHVYSGPYVGDPYGSTCTGQYLLNGAITMQRLVDDWILNVSGATAAGSFVSEAGVVFVAFPTKEFIQEGFFSSFGFVTSIFMTLGLLYPTANSIRCIVQEKELKQKEFMKIMAVTDAAIEWSWFCSLLFLYFWSSLVTAVVSTKFFSFSQLSLLVLFFELVFLASLLYASFIAAFFSKSVRAMLVGLLVFFIGCIIGMIFDTTQQRLAIIVLMSLHPAVALSFGLQLITSLEDQGVGIKNETFSFSNSPSGYSFRITILSLAVSILLEGLLSWYINRVMRGEFGRRHPFYFPFTASYWCPGKTREHPNRQYDDSSTGTDQASTIEPVSNSLKQQAAEGKNVEILRLTKAFNGVTAVDNLTLSVYSGQVTALLGKNGAGKSTVISMLTGLVAPSSGTAVVIGKNITTQMQQLREDIGICLQQDCLFPLLTVKEHIQFFTGIKGMYANQSRDEENAAIKSSMQDVGLLKQRHTMSKNLSGGTKRKLGVAIAFCGNAKVVFLDEPTSGMDPFSRRLTWNIIRQYRQNRIILLTTHLMDEADLLGDRIAILGQGRLRCVGSSLFLKNVYGVGYQLAIEKDTKAVVLQEAREQEAGEPSHAIDQILEHIVLGTVEDGKILSNLAGETIFQLPQHSAGKFAELFSDLDEQIELGYLLGYGISMTTLEEVFLMVSRGDVYTTQAERLESSHRSSMELGGDAVLSSSIEDLGSGLSENDVEHTSSFDDEALFRRHVQALFTKRAMNFRRDKTAWFCSVVLPSLFALLGLVLTLAMPPLVSNLPSRTLSLAENNPDVMGDKNPLPYNPPGIFHCTPGICLCPKSVNVSLTGEHYYFCGGSATLEEFSRSCDFNQEYCGANCSISQTDFVMKEIPDASPFPVGDDVYSVYGSSFAVMDSASSFAATQYGAIFFTHDSASTVIGNDQAYNASAIRSCENDPGLYRSVEQCHGFGSYGYLVSSNVTSLHASLLYQAVADEAILNDALNDEGSISVTIHPLPITEKEASYNDVNDAYISWLILVFSFPFIAGSFATFILEERKSNAKHLQIVSGVTPSEYWLSSYMWDILNYQLPMWIIFGLMFAFDLKAFTTTERGAVGGTAVSMILFGPAVAGFTYCMTFLFDRPGIGNFAVILLNLLVGLGGPLVTFNFQVSDSAKLIRVASILEWVFRFFPSFNLGKSLLFIAFADMMEDLAGRQLSVWSTDILLVEVIFLAIECFAYVVLAVNLDRFVTDKAVRQWWMRLIDKVGLQQLRSTRSLEDGVPVSSKDEDVAAEEERVMSGRADEDNILIKRLTKRYANGELAVDDVSLGIPAGQCFGLIGINGAGKTTLVSVLTAAFPPTSGDAFLCGYSVCSAPKKARRRIGYCPQFSALFMNMTGQEHVELYAVIKGVPKTLVKETAASKLTEVGLDESDANRLSSTYSGGMKRKLSVACATIGRPQILLLDEPSTGMDPVARRDLWSVISNLVTGTQGTDGIGRGPTSISAILTTHSMEECEALCPRIAIMGGGKLRCIGSAQDDDYQNIMSFLLEQVTSPEVEAVGADDAGPTSLEDILRSSPATIAQNTRIDIKTVKRAVVALTGDDSLSSIIAPSNSIGFLIYRDASSDVGVSVDELAGFCARERRVKAIMEFMTRFSGATMRERQESKLRFEVGSEGLRLASLFAAIEENKHQLRIMDYGVSQTTLEQVFNIQATEAEKEKQDTINDGNPI